MQFPEKIKFNAVVRDASSKTSKNTGEKHYRVVLEGENDMMALLTLVPEQTTVEVTVKVSVG